MPTPDFRDRLQVVEVDTDDLGTETGRMTDAYFYTLREVTSDEVLPTSFRHYDLVPVDDQR